MWRHFCKYKLFIKKIEKKSYGNKLLKHLPDSGLSDWPSLVHCVLFHSVIFQTFEDDSQLSSVVSVRAENALPVA